jgi:hypothetical protein
MVDELGIHDDLVDLAFGAVATHVGFPEYAVKVSIPIHAVDDVLEDLLLALSARPCCLPNMIRSKKGRCSGTPTTSFFAPAGLAVGFGPKELSPTLAAFAGLAIHPADLLGP